MNSNDILDALEHIDEETVKNAKEPPKKNRKAFWISMGSIAACFVLVLLVTHILKKTPSQSIRESNPFGIAFAGDYRERNATQLMSSESAILWPWEYRIICNQYTLVEYNGISYQCRVSYSGTPLEPSFVGAKLGDATAQGSDYVPAEGGNVYYTPCEVYEIEGVDSSRFLAIKYTGQDNYYVFMQDSYNPPATLGDLITGLNLPKTFPFTSFIREADGSDRRGLTAADSEALWKMFAHHASAPTLSGTPVTDALSLGKRLISFTVDAPALGVSNLSWTLTENGYLSTNIENYGYYYDLGKDAVNEILAYALSHKTDAPQKELYSLVGEVTEIGEDYIKVDDTLCMKNPKDGMEFTVKLNDLRVKRYVLCGYLKVGSHVWIRHTGTVTGDPTQINTAYELDTGRINADGTILIPE